MRKLYCDGFILLPAGGGFTITDDKGKLLGRGMTERFVTNNEVELQGLKNALALAGIGDTISSDSKICIGWVRKGRSGQRADLNPLMVEAHKLLTSKGVLLVWEGRESNLAGKLNERMHRNRKKAVAKGDTPANAVKSFLSHEGVKTKDMPAAAPIVQPQKPRIEAEPVPRLSQADHLRNALEKRRAGVPVLELSIDERVILEVAHF